MKIRVGLPLALFGITALFLAAFFVVFFFAHDRGEFPASAGVAYLLLMGVFVSAWLSAASFLVGPLVRLKSMTIPLLIVAVGVSFFYDVPSTVICRVLLRSAFEEYQSVCAEDLGLAGYVMGIFGGIVAFRILVILREEKRRREEELGG